MARAHYWSLTAWRYLVRRNPLACEPDFRGMVFPLGMYTASTFEMSQALDLPFLEGIPAVFVFVAIAAWLAAFAGLMRHLVRSMARRRTAAR
ncbi:MAG: hypothetical protein IRZ13_08940 [Acetobacteraceae bacterium]|nr:hypothetical protein [Acetobacteraceae bacterium]